MEKEYFGLQFTDKNGDHLWINLRNPLYEQLPPTALRPTVEMRVKYFVSPQKLMQSMTRLVVEKRERKSCSNSLISFPLHYFNIINKIELKPSIEQ